MISKFAEIIKKTPQNPGIYIFKTKRGEFLYIGKAGNLKNRLRQYLGKKTYAPFLEHILNEAEQVETMATDSEIQALILESKLIKEKKPKYNIMLRDDKQYFYVIFTKEEFPKIYITHQPWAIPSETLVKEGPFTDGTALKTTLRLLRRIFPYCTCKQPHHNFCLNYHIGKCLGFCCLKKNQITVNRKQLTDYKRNIKAIKDILSGKKDYLIKKLGKELNSLAKQQDFEKAIELKNKIEKLEITFANAKIIQDSIYKLALKNTVSLETLKNIFKLLKTPCRIEGYDISNIQGKNATGAMVVFTDNKPDKNEYRKFRIRFKKTPDDTAMLKEVLIRRFNHHDWPYPDLIFIDGGKAQLNAAKNTIAFIGAFSKNINRNTAIISLAKGKQEVFSTTLKKPILMKKLPTEIQNLILNIDAEAHRFAINYYKKLHREAALPKNRF